MNSLRYRLMLTLLAGLLVGGAIGAVGIFWQSMEELNEQFDVRLQSICRNLRPESLARDPQIRDIEASDDIVVQLWSRDGTLLFHSIEEERAPAPLASGFTTRRSATGNWRSFTRSTSDGGYLQVAQELSVRQEIAATGAIKLMLPLLALLPLLAVFTIWAVSLQLRPLRALAAQLLNRGVLSRTVIRLDKSPSELVPVVDALNDLLERQANAARIQQTFLADVAHELRTPLAVVRLQAEQAQRSVSDSERHEALDALKAGVDRATRLVAQLLDLSRSEHTMAEGANFGTMQLDSLVKTVIAQLHPLAADKNIDLGLVECVPCLVFGDAQGLRSVIVNLVDNAIRYSPKNSRVDVSVTVAANKATLTICDSGPGIASEMRDLVFDRFARGEWLSVSGTGLGLAIARQITQQHGGSIELDERRDAPGLVVRVTLPTTI